MSNTRYASKFGPNLKNTLSAIADREYFNAGNLKATHKNGEGQLPPAEADRFSRTATTYVVYSWNTPIAWFDMDTCRWVIPDVRYSVTTSAHQGVVRRALAEAGY